MDPFFIEALNHLIVQKKVHIGYGKVHIGRNHPTASFYPETVFLVFFGLLRSFILQKGTYCL